MSRITRRIYERNRNGENVSGAKGTSLEKHNGNSNLQKVTTRNQEASVDIGTIEDTYDEYIKKSGATENKVIKIIEKKFGVKHIPDDVLATDPKYKEFRDYYAETVTYYNKTYSDDWSNDRIRQKAIDVTAQKYGINIDKNGNVWEGVKYDDGINEERMAEFGRNGTGTLEKIFRRKAESWTRGKDDSKGTSRVQENKQGMSDNNEQDNNRRVHPSLSENDKKIKKLWLSHQRTLSGGVQRLTFNYGVTQ